MRPISLRRGVVLLAVAVTGAAVFAMPSFAEALAAPITIDSIAPSPFSPAGNSPRRETVLHYTVGAAESVSVQVTNGSSTDVYDANLGLQNGAQTWTWGGTDNLSQVVPDGTYTITLTGSLSGPADSITVDVDSTLPTLSRVRGDGVTFYPVRDGYHDSWTSTVNTSETGRVILTIKNAQGAVVRTMRAQPSGPAHLAFTWNGRTRSGKLVPAGRYHWYYTDTDTAGNHSRTPNFVVHVSLKKLVKTTKVVSRQGDAYAGTDHQGCGASTSKANSTFAHGLLLSVTCGNRQGIALAGYNVRLPTAVKYTRMSFKMYGYSHRGYAVIVPLIFSTEINDFELTRSSALTVSSSSRAWRSLGGVPVKGHFVGRHVAHFIFAIGNQPGHPVDFDLKSIKVSVGCYVLR